MCRISHKVGLVLLNGVLSLSSVVLIAIGVSVKIFLDKTPSLLNKHWAIPALLTAAFGVFQSFVSSFAHIGVYWKSHRMLLAYIFLLLSLIVIEVVVGITGFVTSFHILDLVDDTLRSAEAKYTSDSLSSQTWDFLQKDLECCGVHNYSEWFQYLGNSSLPDSCCIDSTVDCGNSAVSTNNAHLGDCALAIKRWVHRHEIIAAIFFPLLVSVKIITSFEAHKYHKTLRNSAQNSWRNITNDYKQSLAVRIIGELSLYFKYTDNSLNLLDNLSYGGWTFLPPKKNSELIQLKLLKLNLKIKILSILPPVKAHLKYLFVKLKF